MTMTLGGLQKNSLIDFPGTVACVVFTSGCNFICPYCHNPDLAAASIVHHHPAVSEADLFAFLKKRKGLLDGVVITGGEPTLQPGLERFCFKLKNAGYRVKLDTNGSRPRVVSRLLERQLVDFVAMDIKSNLAGYRELVRPGFDVNILLESVEIIINEAPAHEFRTTCVRPFIDRHIMEDIGRMIEGADHYVLQPCSKNVEMLTPDFFTSDHHFFTDPEMALLKAQMTDKVRRCSIR